MEACTIISLASFQLAVHCPLDNNSYRNQVGFEIVVRCRRTANPFRGCRPIYRTVPQTLSACELLVTARNEYSPYIEPAVPQVSSKLYVLPQITNSPTPEPPSDHIARLH